MSETLALGEPLNVNKTLKIANTLLLNNLGFKARQPEHTTPPPTLIPQLHLLLIT